MSAEVGQSRWHALLVNGALLVLAVVSLTPLLWMVAVSFMQVGEASRFPPPLLPSSATLANYHEMFARTGMARNFANSVLVSAAITPGSLLFNTLTGYAFAKLRFPGRERVFQLLLAALVIPAQVAMLPLFLLMKQLGLVNTYGGVVVPALAGVFGIFLVRQYARSIPDELMEAARIDGAGEWRIFFSIVLPMLKPVLVTLAIFTFMAAWNDFMWPLIVLTDQGALHAAGGAGVAVARTHHGRGTDDGRRGGDGGAGAAAVPAAAALLHPGPAAGKREGVRSCRW